MKSKNSDLKIKEPKNLKTQLFRLFRFFKNLKTQGFLKWVSTALTPRLLKSIFPGVYRTGGRHMLQPALILFFVRAISLNIKSEDIGLDNV